MPGFGQITEQSGGDGDQPALLRLPVRLRVNRVDALDPHDEQIRPRLDDLRNREAAEEPLERPPAPFTQGFTLIGVVRPCDIERRQAVPVANANIGAATHEERRLLELAGGGGAVQRGPAVHAAQR